jgi:hypothetical protein
VWRIAYVAGLHNFVTHAQSKGKHIFTIRGMESQKLIS